MLIKPAGWDLRLARPPRETRLIGRSQNPKRSPSVAENTAPARRSSHSLPPFDGSPWNSTENLNSFNDFDASRTTNEPVLYLQLAFETARTSGNQKNSFFFFTPCGLRIVTNRAQTPISDLDLYQSQNPAADRLNRPSPPATFFPLPITTTTTTTQTYIQNRQDE